MRADRLAGILTAQELRAQLEAERLLAEARVRRESLDAKVAELMASYGRSMSALAGLIRR